jgi:hypothetical protein
MRVRATAIASATSNAIGAVELECTPAGLCLGLYGVGAYGEGYAPAALTQGELVTVPYAAVRRAVASAERLLLELEAPLLPHDRLTLSRFQAGPGVAPVELRQRRLILQGTALVAAGLAALAAAVLAPSAAPATLAPAAFAYAALAAVLVLLVGAALDRRSFVRPAGEREALDAFVGELERYVPTLVRTDRLAEPPRERTLGELARLVPRGAALGGLSLASALLTALVLGQRMVTRERARASLALEAEAEAPRVPAAAAADPGPDPLAPPRAPSAPPGLAPPPRAEPSAGAGAGAADRASDAGTCLCDRADSPLWSAPIPKLSALLLEKRVLPRKSFDKLRIDLAVVNNGDTPLADITVHVQFLEPDAAGRPRPTKERPLYFAGPLAPGAAVKWTTEARGTDFELLVPDFGVLGVDGAGAARADAFARLLSEANHRPVRLHAARMLSYLGDPRARPFALDLKDALRAAEGPYLRRVLAATGKLRVCDLRVGASEVSACVYNAGAAPASDVGVQVLALDGSLDPSQPLANPPALRAERRWRVADQLPAQTGRAVRMPLELYADRYDLLE